MGDDGHDGSATTMAMHKLKATESVALDATAEHSVENPRRLAIIVTEENRGRRARVVSRAANEIREFRRERFGDAVDGERVRRRHREHDRIKRRTSGRSDAIAVALCCGDDERNIAL